MKKWCKKLLLSSSSILLCGSTALIVTACSTNIQNSSTNLNSINLSNRAYDTGYLYDNKMFSSLDDLCTYYINTHPGIIKSNYYLGDTTNSVLDPSTQMLNINEFKPYDPSKLHPVYLNSLNMPTHNYEEAKKTYVNKGLVSYQYYDFNGNIFDTKEEAKESIINSKNSSGVLYYEDLPISGEITKNFNPLSSKDLLDFQKLAFSEAASKLDTENPKDSNFELKMYENGIEKVVGTLFDENYIHDMILEALDGYFKARLNSLNKLKYSVRLSLDDVEGGRCDYKIINFSTGDRNRIWIDSKDPETINFKNLSLDEVKQFNAFINFDEFWKTSWKEYCYSTFYTIAEEAKVHDFLNTYFEIRYTGWDVGWTGGSSPDFKILSHGAETDGRGYLAFKVDVTIEDNDLTFREFLENDLIDNWKSYIFDESLSKDVLRKMIIKEVWTKIYNDDYNSNLSISTMWDGKRNDSWAAKLKTITNFTNSNVASNELLQGRLKKNLITLSDINNNSSFNSVRGINYKNNIIETSDINKILFNDVFSDGEGDFVIEYNSFPLFSFNFKDSLKYDESYTLVNNYENKYVTNLKNTIFNIYSKVVENEDLYTNFKNVSQTFTRIDGKNKLLDINESLFQNRNPRSKYIKFNENNEMYKEFKDYNQIDPELKEFDSTPFIDYELDSLIPLYNRLIDQIPENSNNNGFVKPEDIVVLRNKEGIPFKFRYKEFLNNGKNTFINLINNQSTGFANSNQGLKELIENTSNIEPAKVVVVYDLLGNVINPGVVLSKDEELSTTSDAIFDSSKTVIDNILRTKLVPRDFNNIYYKENENDQYHLVANKINRIYELNLDGNIYYFPTHFHMMNQLKKYVASFAERIVYNE